MDKEFKKWVLDDGDPIEGLKERVLPIVDMDWLFQQGFGVPYWDSDWYREDYVLEAE